MSSYLTLAEERETLAELERLFTVLDVSLSMEDKDWKPSRLAGAKKAAMALVREKGKLYPYDEVGLISFSSDAELVHPLTAVGAGRKSLESALRGLETDSATNIAAGLRVAARELLPGDGQSAPEKAIESAKKWAAQFLGVSGQPVTAQQSEDRVARRIILLTDGAHNRGGDPRKVAQHLKDRGVSIECVGIGGGPRYVDEACLRAIASKNPDGSPRYWFIGDQEELVEKFEVLGRIRAE